MLGSAAYAQQPAEPQIVVTGEGVVKATPDQAWVSIGAESRSKVSKDAQQRNAEAMTAVMQKLAAFGIPKDAIKTTAIDLQMEFDYNNGKQTPRGYVARNTVEVRVDDLAKARRRARRRGQLGRDDDPWLALRREAARPGRGAGAAVRGQERDGEDAGDRARRRAARSIACSRSRRSAAAVSRCR